MLTESGHRRAADPEVARDYASLKRKLMAKIATEPQAHNERKTDLIRNVELNARAEDGDSIDVTLPR